MLAAVETAVNHARKDNNFWHIDDAAWAKIEAQSVDCAILEKVQSLVCGIFWWLV